uniref:STAT transcription factor DNA-binding domain-containing protein n=1 Tax=Plectus sambesii TaxID=2011161 RepID=A0A914WMI0_9BILA
MDYSAAFFPPYPIHLLKKILAEDLYTLHQWLPTLVMNLEDAVISLKKRKEQIFNIKQQFTKLQKLGQIGENNERIIDTTLQQLTLSYTSTSKEVSNLIRYVHLLQNSLNQGISYQTSEPTIPLKLRGLLSNLIHLWRELVANSLLVSVQPSPIVQKDKSIETEVRLLIDAAIASPTVRCRIINVCDVDALQSGRTTCTQLQSKGRIENDETSLIVKDGVLVSQKYDKKEKHLLLKHIGTLKKSNTAERSLVTELKCVILYEVIPSEDLRRALPGYTDTIWAVSLPVVLITHGNQMADALSTIIWDRAFGDTKQVDWSSLADLLKKTFAYVTGSTKRTLTDQDLQYFRGKLGGNGHTYSYAQFAKDKIGPERKFTFWTYFYSICDVIEKKLLQYWNKGYIMGFSSKEDASRKLGELDKPAFLLRFSDSQLGTLAVIYIKSPATCVKQFLLPAVQPEKTYTVVMLLREFKHLQYVRYICDKNNEPIDKGRFFDDKDLAAEDSAENKKVGGYHNVRLAITFDDNDEDEEEPVIDERDEQQMISSIGNFDQASSIRCSCAWSRSCYSSTNSAVSQLSTSENNPDFYDSLETPTLSQYDFGFSQSASGNAPQLSTAPQPLTTPQPFINFNDQYTYQPTYTPQTHCSHVCASELQIQDDTTNVIINDSELEELLYQFMSSELFSECNDGRK